MSRAHKAILDSLRPHWVQTKRIQSSEVHENLCWNDSQLSPLCDTGTASSSATQSKLQLSRCWGALCSFVLYQATSCVRKSLSRGKGSWKTVWVFSQSPENTLGSADQAGKAVLLQHHLQPARVVGDADRHLAPEPRLGSQLISNTDKFADLRPHSSTPDDPPDVSGSFRSG